MKTLILSIYLLISPVLLFADLPDSLVSMAEPVKEKLEFNKRQLIIPGIFFTYGVASMESDYLKLLNTGISDRLKENIDTRFSIDDFTFFLPAASVYGLNALGLKGKNNLQDRSLILGGSYLLMAVSVVSLKTLTRVERPDESTYNSFPSGHTATAFMGAEFLRQEYKDVSPWIGIAGYAVATGTGFFRLYNNRHWLSDVVMGAGIGILCTKIAYWSFPYVDIQKKKADKKVRTTMAPFYNGKQAGVGLVILLQ